MISQAVVLAAGYGSRLREGGDDRPKPLQEVLGVSLLARTVLTLAEAGVTGIHVVLGYRAAEIRDAITAELAAHASPARVSFLDNPEYDRSNGVSVLCARGHVAPPFLLSMADHLYEAELPRIAAAADMTGADLWLCVDRRVGEVYDLDDATKVLAEGDRIVDIGKQLTSYNCIDAGVFAVGEALFDALDAERARRGDCSLSDGVRALGARGRAGVLDIGDAFWQDVDTPQARARGEEVLRARRVA
jgi:1L-myo-inositol 1-phosphate cytidylyltransferase